MTQKEERLCIVKFLVGLAIGIPLLVWVFNAKPFGELWTPIVVPLTFPLIALVFAISGGWSKYDK
jgi:hypothetical protein